MSLEGALKATIPFLGGSTGLSSSLSILERDELLCMMSSWLLCDDARLFEARIAPGSSATFSLFKKKIIISVFAVVSI